MRREVADTIGSGLLLAALVAATVGVAAEQAAATGTAAGPTAPTAIAAAGDTAIAGDAERGRSLFYAKGCVTCHTRAGLEARAIGEVGPDLTGLAARAGERRPGMSARAYVAESLRSPSAYVVPGYGAHARMPDLGLGDAEIASLVAFLLGTP
jgi:mono/diheme cytochrome c family protein